MSIKGSCCCGGVRFELFEPPLLMGTCHCSRCRKAGSGVYAYVRAEAFHWLAGEDLLTRYRPKPPFRFTRSFCKRCGTSLGDPDSGRILAIAGDPVAALCLAAIATLQLGGNLTTRYSLRG